jgi:hypothetical protein
MVQVASCVRDSVLMRRVAGLNVPMGHGAVEQLTVNRSKTKINSDDIRVVLGFTLLPARKYSLVAREKPTSDSIYAARLA